MTLMHSLSRNSTPRKSDYKLSSFAKLSFRKDLVIHSLLLLSLAAIFYHSRCQLFAAENIMNDDMIKEQSRQEHQPEQRFHPTPSQFPRIATSIRDYFPGPYCFLLRSFRCRFNTRCRATAVFRFSSLPRTAEPPVACKVKSKIDF